MNLGPESWIEVTLPDKSIANVKLIRSRRSKRMRIRVDRRGVSVLSSVNEDLETIRNFIRDNDTWILIKSKFYAKLNSKLEYGPLQKDEIIYLGTKYKIKFVKDSFQYSIFSENLMKITFHVKDRRRCKRNIVNWYREQTKKLLDNKVPFFGKELSISYGKVRVRNQKSRWGSCSKGGNLNFNLLLSSLPINVIDYIIIHELFHLVEFNHSDHFWKLVEHAFPSYKGCRNWLKNNGAFVQLN
ncbi:MAG TPA: SprT family zinc-dependent metalloprotease [Nitrososphaeraceae archaeon]|nr:SprT family zinc-dependent metalloprotease [Nitrososphaeraceae archaeon]